MDHKFTQQIGKWLETPDAERDYTVGALYLLKLSGNQIMYKNIIAQIDRRHDVVEYQLQKYYNFRVQALTHAQVDAIAEEHELTAPQPSDAAEPKALGKREDHDLLPDNIKAKFVENLSILQRMRELHCMFMNQSISIYAQIGIILLLGLSAKNAILIVEYAIDYRKTGLPVRQAAESVGRVRFRPIMMTALAFVFGVMPMLFATGAGAQSRISLGTAVVFGMAVNAIVGTLFVPNFWELMQKKTSAVTASSAVPESSEGSNPINP